MAGTPVAFTGDRAILSNFAPTSIYWDNQVWPDVETAFQAAKTLDPDERQRIAAAPNPGAAKRIGRTVTLRAGWDTPDTGVRLGVMAELLAAKFAPGGHPAALLESTGVDYLCEDNTWGDRFWGRVNGRGFNMLGRLLMARRALNRTTSGHPVVDEHCDLWDLHLSGAWVVVPTNTQRRQDGTATMGAGVAKTAADRFAGLDTRYGAALEAGNPNMAYPEHRVLCVPTKDHWRNPSSIDTVRTAARALGRFTHKHPERPLAVPALGAGLGGLDWDQVREVLIEELTPSAAILLPPK